MRGTIVLAAGVMLAAASPLAAQQGECDDARTQSDMNLCATDRYQAADAEMNRAYAQLRAAIDAEERSALLDAQRAWLRFRDAHCAFEAAGFRGGSMQPMIEANCLAAVTRDRTKQLKDALELADI